MRKFFFIAYTQLLSGLPPETIPLTHAEISQGEA